MAGLGSEAVVPLRPELAVNLHPLQLGVEQNAVAAMTDAFRKGQIEANDVIERYSVLNKAKEKVAIQNLDEFISPQAIVTRQNQRAALNTDAILKSSPEYIASREAEMQATINSAQAGSYPDMLKAAVGLGFFPQNRDATWTDAKKQEIAQLFSDARNYKAFSEKSTRDAKRFLPAKEPVTTVSTNEKGEREETVESPTGEDVNYYDENNQHVPKEVKFAADRAAGMSAEDWILAGKPAYDPYGSLVTERATPVAAKTQVDYDEETEITETNADGSTKVTKKTKTPTGAPRRITKITPIASTEKQPTEAQQRAQTAIQKFAQSGRMEDAIAGYDPTTYSSWIAGLMPNFLRFGAQSRQTFEAARDLWQQGLLRMESGAAISPSEKVWYNTTFFPELNDPPALVEAKGNARRGVEDTVAEIANAGGVVSPESVHAAWDLKQQRAGASSTQTGATTGGGVETPISTGTLIKKPGGGFTVRAGASTNAVVTPRGHTWGPPQ